MQSRSRAGFTLIELMVSMTLTLVIMAILSQAFVTGLATLSGLKGIGDMQQNLRTATVVLHSDLATYHFEGNRLLSDASINNPISLPQAGFFGVLQGSAPNSAAYPYEGADRNSLPSYRATDHVLYFTARRSGNRQESFFTTGLLGNTPNSPAALGSFFANSTAYGMPPLQVTEATLTSPYVSGSSQGFYSSQWAEVVYYLLPTGTTTDPTLASGVPTYSLYRAQFVMAPDGTKVNQANIPTAETGTFSGVACYPDPSNGNFLKFPTPADTANLSPTGLLQHTIDLTNFNSANMQARLAPAATLLLPNVVSFQVQIMPAGTMQFSDVPSAGTTGTIYDTALFAPSVSTTTYNNRFGLKAIQVTLRIWDPNTRQTRQATVVQEF